MNWKELFKKPMNVLEGLGEGKSAKKDCLVCSKCGGEILKKSGRAELYVCPMCGGYFRVTPRQRLNILADEGSFTELFCDVTRDLPFDFPGYDEKLAAAAKKSGEYDSVTSGVCSINGQRTVIFIMNGSFMMGSMGYVAGEKLARCFEYATSERLPVTGVTISGGARMQEGIISLMQMAKVSGAIRRHGDAGNLYITLLTDPTTGGVSASLAMLGDVIIAEPRALICFAGPRVIEQTLRQKLPENFRQAEELLADGFIDDIVERKNQREYIADMIKYHSVGWRA